jgi:hypothetical protein
MKKVILVISGAKQPNAAGFIEEYEKLNGRIDKIICLHVKHNFIFYIKKPLRFLKYLKPSAGKQSNIKIFGLLYGMQTIDSLKKSWNVSGENSWDLLKTDIDILNFAKQNSIPVEFAIGFSKQLIERNSTNPTLYVLYGGGIIPKNILDIENAEFINAHMGEMPRYRGMNVIEWAVLEDNLPKVSVMTMNEQIDGGDLILVRDIHLTKENTIADLRRTGFINCYKAMAEGIYKYSTGEAVKTKQPSGARYYYRMHLGLRDLLKEKLENNYKSIIKD